MRHIKVWLVREILAAEDARDFMRDHVAGDSWDEVIGVYSSSKLAKQAVLVEQGKLDVEAEAEGMHVRIMKGHEFDHNHQFECYGLWWVINQLEMEGE